MNPWHGESRIRPAWWAAMLIAFVVATLSLCFALFAGTFSRYVQVILKSDRAGLVMESGAKVKMHGIEVGKVAAVSAGEPVVLTLDIYPDQIQYIPANVEAEIKATTAFGAKYVELLPPTIPSPKRLAAGEVLRSRNVSTEINTVFENLVDLLHQMDPAKLNAVLTALAEGVRGQGEAIGVATTDANQVLTALNARHETIRADLISFRAFSDTYGAAAQNVLATFDAATTTSSTIVDHAAALDMLLLNVIGMSHSGIDLLAQNQDNLVNAVDNLEPTTNLLLRYNPEYTCTIEGTKLAYDELKWAEGANGKSVILDAAILLGQDPYRYPDNLPIIAAKGGQGGKPSCGSLPDISRNFPVRQLVMNTGWGTGTDIRTNPGLGHPCYVNFFPVTRAVPEQPSTRCQGPPSPENPWPPPGPLPFDIPPAPAANPPVAPTP